jgi:hypothetical protein
MGNELEQSYPKKSVLKFEHFRITVRFIGTNSRFIMAMGEAQAGDPQGFVRITGPGLGIIGVIEYGNLQSQMMISKIRNALLRRKHFQLKCLLRKIREALNPYGMLQC